GIEPLSGAGEADEVGEQDRDGLAFLTNRRTRLRRERAPARVTEASFGAVLVSALRAGAHPGMVGGGGALPEGVRARVALPAAAAAAGAPALAAPACVATGRGHVGRLQPDRLADPGR